MAEGIGWEIVEPHILAVSARVRPSRSLDRDDIRQELRLAAWRAAPLADPAKGSPLAFLKKVVDNRLVDILRREGRRSAAVTLPEEVPEVPALPDSVRMDCREILASLPPECRRACRELAGGRTISALAEAEGMSRETFRRRVLRPIVVRIRAAGYGFTVKEFSAIAE